MNDDKSNKKKEIKLYRFEKASNSRIKSIERGEFFFSSRDCFNDPFETIGSCYVRPISHTHFSMGKLRRSIKELYADLESLKWPITNEVLHHLKNWLESEKTKDALSLEQAIFNELNKTPTCCFFSAGYTNPAMWAYYADDHKGFCVEYTLSYDDNIGLFEIDFQEAGIILKQVKYTSVLDEFNIARFLFDPSYEGYKHAVTKSSAWSKEQEYRLISYGTSVSGLKKIPCTKSAEIKVTGIYMGYKLIENNPEACLELGRIASKIKVPLKSMIPDHESMLLISVNFSTSPNRF